MDPEARRFIWSVIEKVSQRDKKSAVILSTHSMEEAEALSTKMGIMVRGGLFRCFGSSQHIKSKFATGFEIQIKIRVPRYAELELLKNSYGFTQALDEHVNLNEALKQIKDTGNIDQLIIDQISTNGIGASLMIEAQNYERQIKMTSLIHYLYT